MSRSNGSVELNTVSLAGRPSLVEVDDMRFLILDAPKEHDLPQYLLECKKNNVVHLVRVCQPTYNAEHVESAGIHMHEMEYADGSHPPQEVIDKWLDVVEQTFSAKAVAKADEKPCIAVHCVAGLGRAPVLVAIALIEFAALEPTEAVTLIRKQRRGAINSKQLQYLESYVATRAGGACSCVIM
uniref:protein-tyrosine-phosphatase n=1 Tax=Pinguiococcus pyrenoidosus TaxID=172671 RepID=A0A7R9Y7Z4_9STRA|mmetsp:Transcript_11553/g.43150  ORF Transcript_11553/g.43150 Transcript_11553/m.43150 type:complete len:184 (+) Transcript_11553:368-919(+)